MRHEPVTLALILALGGLAACDPEPTDATDAPDLPVDTDLDTDTDSELPPVEWLAINEFMASNAGSLELEDGSSPDWIELANPGEQDVSLDGWSISDDDDRPRRWLFDPSLSVPAGGYLLLYADDAVQLGPTHLDFGLKAEGEHVLITDPYGRRIDWVRFGQQQPDLAAARRTDGDADSDWYYVIGGTPGAANAGE